MIQLVRSANEVDGCVAHRLGAQAAWMYLKAAEAQQLAGLAGEGAGGGGRRLRLDDRGEDRTALGVRSGARGAGYGACVLALLAPAQRD